MFNRIINVSFLIDNSELVLDNSLRFIFTVKKTVTSETNTCNIDIYNLSESTINLINNNKEVKLILKAGYADESIKLIYIGDSVYTNTIYSPPNKVTSLFCGDGTKALTKTKINVSYNKKSSLLNILKSTAKTFGLSVKDFVFSGKDIILNKGISFSGQSRSLMDKLCVDLGLTWSIQNDQVKIVNNNNFNNSLIEISPESGLIKSPERVKLKLNNEDILGYKINSLLIPELEPGDKLSLSSRQLGNSKLFNIYTVTHYGDNYSGDFKSEVELYV